MGINKLIPSVLIALVVLSLLLQACTVPQGDPIANPQIIKPMAYVKRPANATLLADPRTNAVMTPGGDLYLHDLDNGPNSDADINITGRFTAAIQGVKEAGDVMSVSTSYDGSRIIFAMHEGLLNNAVAPNQNTWDIWEYLISPRPGETALRRVMSSNLDAREGNDLDPVYLPDGRIVFTSDRQVGGQAQQLLYGLAVEPSFDERRRREPALNLHIMSAIGKDRKQISYNQSDDRFPSVLNTGEIVFSRWAATGNTESRFDLYSVLPDGSEMKLLYGSHSHFASEPDPSNPGGTPLTFFDQAFYKPQQMADGRLVAMLMPFSGNVDPDAPVLLDNSSAGGGELVIIDYENFADVDVPRKNSTSPQQSVGHISATGGKANTRLGFPTSGRYSSPFPIWEAGDSTRILISLALCTVVQTVDMVDTILPCKDNETLPLAPPEYGLYFLDPVTNTTIPVLYSEPGMVLTDAVVMLDRTALLGTPVNAVPTMIPDKTVASLALDGELAAARLGAIKIRSVYDSETLATLGLVASELVANEQIPPCMTISDSGNKIASSACNDADRSVVVDLEALSVSTATQTADNRPIRFVRVVGAMPSLDMTDRFSYGIPGNEMRAILGYAPVEPDGSVYVEVPADVPFALELVGKDGRKFLGRIINRGRSNATRPDSTTNPPTRTTRAHEHWLQVIPGETKECHGCHEGHSGAAALNSGAGGVLSMPFRNTLAAMAPNPGETMAETRIRINCESSDCSERKLNRDLVYKDVWTDPVAANRAADPDYATEYNDRSVSGQGDGLSGGAPIYAAGGTSDCQITDYGDPTSQGFWAANCRIVIDYEKHIQPLWDKTRMVDDGTGTGSLVDRRCTICHSTVKPLGGVQVPKGASQLDLTSDGPRYIVGDADNNIPYSSYEELLRRGIEVTDATGAITPVENVAFVTIDLDNDGLPDVDPVTLEVILVEQRTPKPLAAGPVISQSFSARRSYLMEVMSGTELNNGRNLPPPSTTFVATEPYIDHTNMMTRGELRVITEWIEMGVQYYNDPSAAP